MTKLKARNVLDLEVEVDLEEALEETLEVVSEVAEEISEEDSEETVEVLEVGSVEVEEILEGALEEDGEGTSGEVTEEVEDSHVVVLKLLIHIVLLDTKEESTELTLTKKENTNLLRKMNDLPFN